MKMNGRHRLLLLAGLLMLLAGIAVSCDKESGSSYKDTIYGDRKVMILYSAGHNSLSSALLTDINELIAYSDLHTDDEDADALLIFTHSRSGDAIPYLIYPHLDKNGVAVIDTLVTYTTNTISASAQTLNTVLTYIKNNFPADEYGLVFSSHATGYLPAGYYGGYSSLENSYSASSASSSKYKAAGIHRPPTAVPATEYPENSLVKSVGQDYYSSANTYEMDLQDFANAIPMDLEYMVFDACFMGGIEVAYELRDKTHWLIASPTEILSDGMDYTTMTSYLTARPEGDFEGFCENYFNIYDNQTGTYQSATISLTDCTKLEPLAQICSELFSKYRDALDAIDRDTIQRYWRETGYFDGFYDLADIVRSLGCTDSELAEFEAALASCITYKAATDNFISFAITSYSGLSMMLPNRAGDYLKNFYTNLDWNKATSLVE